MARAGYIEDRSFVDSDQGVPQGGVLSPILSNIYLHEFDEFMQDYISKHSHQGKYISKVNPKMTSYSDKLSLLNKRYQENHDPEIIRQIRALRIERNKIPSRIRTGNRVSYVRYADD